MSVLKIDNKAINVYVTPELAVLKAMLNSFHLYKTLTALTLLQIVFEAELQERQEDPINFTFQNRKA